LVLRNAFFAEQLPAHETQRRGPNAFDRFLTGSLPVCWKKGVTVPFRVGTMVLNSNRPLLCENLAMREAGDITRLLQEAEQGNREAAERLFVLVEEDLRKIARKRKRGINVDANVSTTVLVDEAFCRLVGQAKTAWQPGDRRKFFGYISVKIHDLLIDLLRKQQAKERGGDWQRVELEAEQEGPSPGPADRLDLLLDLKDALLRLQEFAWNDAVLFRIRFFLECTFEETAEIMGISKTEAVRSYQRTQLWLRRELKEYDLDA
jgi:RNA polymerase sigma factor (TIGR02999 family)